MGCTFGKVYPDCACTAHFQASNAVFEEHRTICILSCVWKGCLKLELRTWMCALTHDTRWIGVIWVWNYFDSIYLEKYKNISTKNLEQKNFYCENQQIPEHLLLRSCWPFYPTPSSITFITRGRSSMGGLRLIDLFWHETQLHWAPQWSSPCVCVGGLYV